MDVFLSKCPTLKRTKCSLVLIDPPFGWNLAEWDKPECVWESSYWTTIFISLSRILAPNGVVAVFGDSFNVLPALMEGLKGYESHAEKHQKPSFVAKTPLYFNKTNHPHKGTGAYAQSVEQCFLFFYQSAPKISKFSYELGGNLITAASVTGARKIYALDGSSNPCQKSHLWLDILLANHAVSDTLVVDLTAGSFSSFMACYLAKKDLHWVGCDIHPDFLENWTDLLNSINNNTKWFKKFVLGKSFLNFISILIFILAIEEEHLSFVDYVEYKPVVQEICKQFLYFIINLVIVKEKAKNRRSSQNISQNLNESEEDSEYQEKSSEDEHKKQTEEKSEESLEEEEIPEEKEESEEQSSFLLDEPAKSGSE